MPPESNAPPSQDPPSQAAVASQLQASAPSQPSQPPQADISAIRADAERAYNAKLKELTGADTLEALQQKILKDRGDFEKLAAQHKTESEQWKQRYHASQAQTAIQAAAIDAGAIDPTVVQGLLAGKATVDDKGAVTVDGKPVAEAVKSLLADKPFLVRATGNQGSGAPVGGQATESEIEREARRIANMHKPQTAHVTRVQ